MHMAMLKSSRVSAGSDFINGSLTFKCINTAPTINKKITNAAGKTIEGIQSPNKSMSAKLIFKNPIT